MGSITERPPIWLLPRPLGSLPTLVKGRPRLALTLAAIGGAGNGVQWVSIVSAIQGLTASAYQARVVGLLESIGRVMPGVGFILGGVIAQVLDPRASFVVAGAGSLTVLIVAMPLLRQVGWTDAGPPKADAPPGETAEPANI